ncbi:MAG: hypothetical protein ACLFQK_02125 [Fibrobacterota bacterium]
MQKKSYLSFINNPVITSETPYKQECITKTNAFNAFWEAHNLPGFPEPLVLSPKPRIYRTTSKRSLQYNGQQCSLVYTADKVKTKNEAAALLEPLEHGKLYQFLATQFNTPLFGKCGRNLNYVIVRGNYTERTLIFNAKQLNASVVKKLSALADLCRKQDPNLISSFLFSDPSGSAYYLDTLPRTGAGKVKKFFGPAKLLNKLDGLYLYYDPFSFSQINQSLVPELIAAAEEFLKPSTSHRLIDLYCGYGLFALALGRKCAGVFGMDSNRGSIESVEFSAQKARPPIKSRFKNAPVTAQTVSTAIPKKINKDELLVLDPPFSGTEKGVIPALAERGPSKVIHLFCNVDRVPAELKIWMRCGYKARSVKLFDMFPGTPNLEIMVALER